MNSAEKEKERRVLNQPKATAIRADDLLRHLRDLRTGSYEGVKSRSAKEAIYRRGIELLTPIVKAILEEANTLFLEGTGEIQVRGPMDDGTGGLETHFELSWPEQREAQVTQALNKPLEPVRIVVNYSQNFLHPHLSGSTAGYWPFQVTNESDAERQKGILAAIVELELHQLIFETNWQILPVSRHWE
jgi:hypothetical protein